MEDQQISFQKNKVNIFLDENITIRTNIKTSLLRLGYKNVFDVYEFNYKSKNDGVLLGLIKERKMILVTFDYRFYKMALKYNPLPTLLLHTHPTTNEELGDRTYSIQIQNFLLQNGRLIREVLK